VTFLFRLKCAFVVAKQKPLFKVAFSVGAVLVASSGDKVSFNTTVGGVGMSF